MLFMHIGGYDFIERLWRVILMYICPRAITLNLFRSLATYAILLQTQSPLYEHIYVKTC